MVDGGWPYIWASYAVTFGALIVLVGVVVLRLRHWAARAKQLERDNPK